MDLTVKTEQLNSAPRHKGGHWIHHRCYMDEHESVQCH